MSFFHFDFFFRKIPVNNVFRRRNCPPPRRDDIAKSSPPARQCCDFPLKRYPRFCRGILLLICIFPVTIAASDRRKEKKYRFRCGNHNVLCWQILVSDYFVRIGFKASTGGRKVVSRGNTPMRYLHVCCRKPQGALLQHESPAGVAPITVYN